MIFLRYNTASTVIYTLSLHDALPIWRSARYSRALSMAWATRVPRPRAMVRSASEKAPAARRPRASRSEEHTSELQSHVKLVCRLLLENKNARRMLCLVAAGGLGRLDR